MKYGGIDVSDARRLKSLKEENGKLKRLLAGAMRDVSTLREMLGKTSDDWVEEDRRGLGDREQGLFAAPRLRGLVRMEPRVLGLVCRFINEAIRHLIEKMGMQEFSAAFTAENVEFHKRILGAFQAGDAELAKRVMYDHMLSAETIVLPADAQAQQSFFAKPLGLD